MYQDRCPDEATQVADVPVIGESICFCDKHVEGSPGSKWYPLTAERAKEEEESEGSIRKMLQDFRLRFHKWPDKEDGE
jgi:hypothetical protein